MSLKKYRSDRQKQHRHR